MPMDFWHPIIRIHLLLILLLAPPAVMADEVSIFDVHQNLALSNSETSEKDYYVNAGLEDGLKEDMVVTVQRRQNLYDHYQDKSPGDLMVEVGEVKVIHAQKSVSVVRTHKIFDDPGRPALNYRTFMVGDQLKMASARQPSSKSRKEEKASKSSREPKNPPVQKPKVVLGPVYGSQPAEAHVEEASQGDEAVETSLR